MLISILFSFIFFYNYRNNIFGWNSTNKQRVLICSKISQSFKNYSTNPLSYNTNVKNNVLLYKYERPWAYKLAFAFGIVTLFGCFCIANNIYIICFKQFFNTDVALKTRLYDHIFPMLMIVTALIGGKILHFICIFANYF
jgi:hypothetical protein